MAWNCAGCGIEGETRERICDCATSVVINTGNRKEGAWKIDRYSPITDRQIEKLRFALADKLGISADIVHDALVRANDELTK